jgi:hypothetical protein
MNNIYIYNHSVIQEKFKDKIIKFNKYQHVVPDILNIEMKNKKNKMFE